MYTLQLFGGCALLRDGNAIAGPATQRRRLALLALLTSSPGAAVSRDKLVAYFWPDADRERARHFLSDSLSTLRKALGKDSLVIAGEDVKANPDVLDADVARFERLVTGGDLLGAIALYRGPFLDGFFVSDAPEFERWVDAARDGWSRRYAACLERVAVQTEAEADWATAADWWRRLAAHDPLSSRVALRTMRALEANGDVAGALQHARVYESRVREELGLASDPAVLSEAERLRSGLGSPSSARRTPPLAIAVRPMKAPGPAGPPIPPEPSLGQPLPDGDSAFAAPQALASITRDTTRGRLTPRSIAVAVLVVAIATIGMLVKRVESAGHTGDGRGGATTASAGVVAEMNAPAITPRDAARELYTQGRYTLTKGQFDPAIYRRALELFREAVDRDPTFAPAYAGIADVYNQADEHARAKEAAIHALSLDSTLAEGYAALAYVLAFHEHRWDAADSVLQHAIALNPRYVLAYLRRANLLAAQNRIDEAVAALERARELQPESFVVLLNRGMVADIAGRPDEAIAHLQAALVLEPGRIDAQYMLARAYWGQQRYREAQAIMRSIGNVAGIAAMSGNRDTMTRLAPLLAASSISDSIRKAAALYVRLGRPDDAFDQLDRLFERGDKFLALDLRTQPFVAMRDNPRYARLLAKLGLSK